MREYALVLLVAAAVTYVLTPLVRRIAIATHTIHEPRARDTHTKATPLLGGLAMYGGLVAGLLVASRLSFLQDPFVSGSRTEAGLLIAGAFVVVVGFADDRWGLSALSKLAAQVAAAGILVWSGQALPWLPTPGGGVFLFEPDLSVTLTILLIVVTMNAINFIDGLDGLAAGITAVAALSFLVYSYTLIRTIGATSQSLPAVSSALLAGMCLGFLPHNFFPARIFMGDIGSMLLGLLLAYGPISSTASLAPALLTNYGHHNAALNRFPTLLPLLVPAAIFAIPYADLMFAVIRRTRAGKPLMAADRQHLHHRLLNIGHSYRQSVLLMYLWAALFSVTVVSLSVVRSPLAVFAAATVIAVLALLPATMPRLRPWRVYAQRKAAVAAQTPRTPHAAAAHAAAAAAARVGASAAHAAAPAADASGPRRYPGPRQPVPASPFPPSDGFPNGSTSNGGLPNGARPHSSVPHASLQNGSLPHTVLPNGGLPQAGIPNDRLPQPGIPNDQYPGLPDGGPLDGRVLPADTMPDLAAGRGPVSGYPAGYYPPSAPEFPSDPWPRADRIPEPEPFPGPARIGGYLRAPNSFSHSDQSRDPAPFAEEDGFAAAAPFAAQGHPSGAAPFPGTEPLADEPGDGGAPFPPAPHPDSQPW
jgi:UDP-GlcNAc:undecaprenyl-phosphate GlcNAc-1-phosphate transferase